MTGTSSGGGGGGGGGYKMNESNSFVLVKPLIKDIPKEDKAESTLYIYHRTFCPSITRFARSLYICNGNNVLAK